MECNRHTQITAALEDMRLSGEDITKTINEAQHLTEKDRNIIRRSAKNVLAALLSYEEASECNK